MNFLARIFRFLFWLVLVSWSVALLRRIVAWMLRGAITNRVESDAARPAAEMPTTARRLVRDPVCGVHIAEVLAIPLREGGEVVHFCSTACRDQYVGNRKIAANG
jgi:YHS domain-containing protein